METDNKKKYPLLLVHGCGFRDNRFLNYWGRIPSILQKKGENIFYANQESWATIETNAQIIKKRVLEILELTHSKKVNIIAHSKGGLECRYMISTLDMSEKVASLSTVSTPHHGSITVENLCKFPDCLFKFIGLFINGFSFIMGDRKPDFVQTSHEFSYSYIEKFNINNPDATGVFYQSYATAMKNFTSDILMLIPYIVVKKFDGQCDGLVSVNSAKWTNFKGIYLSAGRRGISHADAVDARRHRFTKKTKEGFISDISELYLDIIKHLPVPEMTTE